MRRFVFIGILALVLPVLGLADVITLEPVKDNTLYEAAGGSTSNGAGDHIFVGLNAGLTRRRAVLAFDVAGSLPAPRSTAPR